MRAKAAMKRAWTIRKQAALRWQVRVGQISMSECLIVAWSEIKGVENMAAKTVREFIDEATKEARSQVDLDKIWHNGFPRKIQEAFPAASASEIMYEWDSVKIRIRKMV